jgi:hypothetical protein
VTDLAELNRLFAAWVETCYHRTVHSETGQTPLARWSAAGPHRIGRHSHPKAKPETPTAPPKPSGIDYARLIETAHQAELARGVNYAALSGADQIPGPARPTHQRAGATPMMDNLISYYGFSRTPFGRDLAPGMLHRHSAHNEALARITWCVDQRAIGVITGEVDPGSHC